MSDITTCEVIIRQHTHVLLQPGRCPFFREVFPTSLFCTQQYSRGLFFFFCSDLSFVVHRCYFPAQPWLGFFTIKDIITAVLHKPGSRVSPPPPRRLPSPHRACMTFSITNWRIAWRRMINIIRSSGGLGRSRLCLLEPRPVGCGGGALRYWHHGGKGEAAAGAADLVPRQLRPLLKLGDRSNIVIVRRICNGTDIYQVPGIVYCSVQKPMYNSCLSFRQATRTHAQHADDTIICNTQL